MDNIDKLMLDKNKIELEPKAKIEAEVDSKIHCRINLW